MMLLGAEIVCHCHCRIQIQNNVPESSRNKDSLTGVLNQFNLNASFQNFKTNWSSFKNKRVIQR